MRPPGEIRRATLHAAWEVAVERACTPVAAATRRDVELRLVPAGVARHAVKHTWENLVRAGLLQPVARVRLPDSPRQQMAYAPVVAVAADSGTAHGDALGMLSRAFFGSGG
jgi:hypothetical protein